MLVVMVEAVVRQVSVQMILCWSISAVVGAIYRWIECVRKAWLPLLACWLDGCCWSRPPMAGKTGMDGQHNATTTQLTPTALTSLDLPYYKHPQLSINLQQPFTHRLDEAWLIPKPIPSTSEHMWVGFLQDQSLVFLQWFCMAVKALTMA